jgi:predicted nucleotidyltransferase component of viral defense system
MTILPLITRQQLQATNRQARKYVLDTAEKDYFIACALALIAASPLADTLVFKGGTALHHCYLDHYRFSEDIDFSCRAPGSLSLEDVRTVLEHEGVFQVRKSFVSKATIKIERLWYAGILDQPGAIKVEIDQLQNVVLPPQQRNYSNDWGIPIILPVMDIREICAEKIRAASQRARYRDFYDLYLIFEQYAPSLDEIIVLLQQKEVRRPITSDGLKENWQRAVQEFHSGKDLMTYSHAISATDIAALLSTLQWPPVFPLSDVEQA